jgi:hypothetical protein
VVLLVALAIGPGIPDFPGRGAGLVQPVHQATEVAIPIARSAADAEDGLASSTVLVAGDRVDDVAFAEAARRVTFARSPAATLTHVVVGLPPVESGAAAPSAATSQRWRGAFNLYRTTAFVTQKDFRWCVAAAVQMMVNIVRKRSDRTAATQERMILYAQASDHGPYGPGGGTDVTGWIATLRHFGAGKYRAVGTRTAGAALRIAATAMRQTGRPAGMLVMDGRHAWILHGFESRTDPKRDRRARITSVRVSGPLYPVQQKHGYDLRPNTELSVDALARYFLPSSVGALAGKYVVIVPVH